MTAIPYIIDGREYEIKAVQTDQGLTVSIFHEGQRLAVYSADSEIIQDSEHSAVPLDQDALVNQAKSDLDAGIVK